MKTAEQFKHSIGKADEAFVHGIRQTLAELECKEEKPVKKKISMGLVLAAAIAFSRLYLYVHWPSDVLGGILLGAACGWAGSRLVEKAEEHWKRKAGR